MKKDRFNNHDNETRDLVLDFEKNLGNNITQFYDIEELETIINYYFDVDDFFALTKAIGYAEQLYPDSTEVKIWRAHWWLYQHDASHALDILLPLYQQEPSNTDLDYALASVYSEMGEHQKAIDHYLTAANDGWDLSRIYSDVAEEYYELENYPNAINYYLKSLKENPLDSTTLNNYTDTCITAKCADEAATFIRQLLNSHPYYKEAWHCLGLAYNDLGFYEKAIDAYEYAIAIDPAFAAPYMELSFVYESQGLVPQAALVLHRMTEHSTDPTQGLLMLGTLYFRAENQTTAQQYLRQALKHDPQNPDVHAYLGLSDLQLGESDSALSHADTALEIAPENANALFCAAMASFELNNKKEASNYYHRLLNSPDCTEVHCKAFAHFLYYANLYDDLIDYTEETLLFSPDDDFYSTYLAAALFHTNRYKQLSDVLPHTNIELLHEICPQMWDNPLLIPLLP